MDSDSDGSVLRVNVAVVPRGSNRCSIKHAARTSSTLHQLDLSQFYLYLFKSCKGRPLLSSRFPTSPRNLHNSDSLENNQNDVSPKMVLLQNEGL